MAPKKDEKKWNKDELVAEVVQRLCVSSATWKRVLEDTKDWEQRVFLLKKKKDIDRLIADWKQLTT